MAPWAHVFGNDDCRATDPHVATAVHGSDDDQVNAAVQISSSLSAQLQGATGEDGVRGRPALRLIAKDLHLKIAFAGTGGQADVNEMVVGRPQHVPGHAASDQGWFGFELDRDLTVHDESTSGHKTNTFTLDCLTERMTVRELDSRAHLPGSAGSAWLQNDSLRILSSNHFVISVMGGGELTRDADGPFNFRCFEMGDAGTVTR